MLARSTRPRSLIDPVIDLSKSATADAHSVAERLIEWQSQRVTSSHELLGEWQPNEGGSPLQISTSQTPGSSQLLVQAGTHRAFY